MLSAPSRELFANLVRREVRGRYKGSWLGVVWTLITPLVMMGAYTLVFTVPTGTPLDGGDRLGDGAHALQLRMEAMSGFEVLATGMTVGGPVPTSVPTGDGPMALGRPLLFVLLMLAGGLGALLGPSRSGWPALRVG
jgi:hypothetical protein